MRAKKVDDKYTGDEVIRMSHSVRFDTLAYANRLKSAGVPDKQAEAQSGALAEIFDEQSASKKDLQETEARLIAHIDNKIVVLKSEMDDKIDKSDDKINKKIEVLQNQMSDLKTDVVNIKIEMATFKIDVTTQIASIKVDLTRWAIGLIFAQSAVLVSLLKFFH